MGLLDQVLGQVVGRMGGSGAQPGPAPRGGGSGQGSSGMNPLLLAILALVASRTLGSGAGGLGSKLRDLITGGSSSGHGSSPGGGLETSGLPGGGGILEDSEPQSMPRHRGDGGFLDSIGSMLDNPHPGGDPRDTGGERRAPAGVPPRGRGGGMFADGLGGGLGGLGGLAGSGLGGLLERFQQSGRGDLFNSWVGPGANEPITPDDLAGALGDDTVDELSRGTGMGRDDLLSQLSQALPQVVDGLTPDGRLPDENEESRWV